MSGGYFHPDTGAVCPACGGAFRFFFSSRGAEWLKCRGCGLVRLGAHPWDALSQGLYREEYFSSPDAAEYGYTDYLGEAERYHRSFGLKARRILRQWKGKPGRVLDIGCAAGFFLEVMRAEGWEVYGIDPSESMLRRARQVLGDEAVVAGSFEEAPWSAGFLDMITLWDTLEHLTDPAGLVGMCRRLLRPGGILCVQTQDPESLLARVSRGRWHHYKFAEHFWHFPVRALKRLVSAGGFREIRVTRRSAGRWVTGSFMRVKLRRYLPWFTARVRLPEGMERKGFYVNPGDEYILTAVRV